MDLNSTFQIKEKAAWWTDAVFYFCISLLAATVFCYFIFLAKNNIQREEIKAKEEALLEVGTTQEKEYQKNVLTYQQKIKDFSDLFENHEFASNVFGLIQSQAMQEVWFSQFALDRKNRKVQLFGEANGMESFSRQVDTLERNENVESIKAINSSISDSTNVKFNINLTLNSKLFSYIQPSLPDIEPVETASPSGQEIVLPQNTAKIITVFNFLLEPEVLGEVNHINQTIKLDVPQGTNVTQLKPFIVVSPGAVVSPEAGIEQDFTNPVVYRVTAEDGSFQDYTVTANILPETIQPKKGSWIIVLIVIILIGLVGGVLFFFLKIRPAKSSAEGGSASGGKKDNFLKESIK